MAEQENYFNTIEKEMVAEYKDRGSKFIAYVFPISKVEDFKQRIQALKKEHPKANHFCFAYKLGIDGNIFRSSDDGEPAGTAGKPILGQLTSKGLTNNAIIVVRYFGGTLLGVPGLINAYKTAAAICLQLGPISKKPVTITCQIDFDYTQMNEVIRWVKNFNAEIILQEIQLFCKLIVQIPKASIQEAQTVFSQMQGITFSLPKA